MISTILLTVIFTAAFTICCLSFLFKGTGAPEYKLKFYTVTHVSQDMLDLRKRKAEMEENRVEIEVRCARAGLKQNPLGKSLVTLDKAAFLLTKEGYKVEKAEGHSNVYHVSVY